MEILLTSVDGWIDKRTETGNLFLIASAKAWKRLALNSKVHLVVTLTYFTAIQHPFGKISVLFIGP